MPARGDADDMTRGSTLYLHRIVEAAESSSRCAHCDAILRPGADSWRSPADPLFDANFSVHEIASLADSPMWCVRCDRRLEPGTDAARAFDSTGGRGIVCRDCGGERPSVSGLPA